MCAGCVRARLVAYLALFGEIRLVLDVLLCRFGRVALRSRSRRPSPNKNFYSVWESPGVCCTLVFSFGRLFGSFW